jgi:thiamine biosynthesis lipoprotein ApbE
VALMAATVVAEDLALADGYATAAMVLGDEALPWLTHDVGVAAMVVTNDRRLTCNTAFDALRVAEVGHEQAEWSTSARPSAVRR